MASFIVSGRKLIEVHFYNLQVTLETNLQGNKNPTLLGRLPLLRNEPFLDNIHIGEEVYLRDNANEPVYIGQAEGISLTDDFKEEILSIRRTFEERELSTELIPFVTFLTNYVNDKTYFGNRLKEAMQVPLGNR